MTAPEPSPKKAVAFFDGQNLYHAARKAFGCQHPNFDPRNLAQAVCAAQRWTLDQVRFYTGLHSASENPFWHGFWTNKLRAMGRGGVEVFSFPLRYRTKTIQFADGSTHSWRTGEEKGVDVRIALDVIAMAFHLQYDVALIFSQDQDLAEVAREIRTIARTQNRWITIASAFPATPQCISRKGVNHTDWIPIYQAVHDSCIDPADYRPKPKTRGTP